MAAKPENLKRLRAAIDEDPAGNRSSWLEKAGLNKNFWRDHPDECWAVYNESCKEQFKDIQKLALKAVQIVLSDPDRKDYADMAKFALTHSEWITPEKSEIVNSNITINIETEEN